MTNTNAKIAVLGYYGKGNLGDERIRSTFVKALSNHDLTFFLAWSDLKFRIDEINQHDALIIGGGGLIIRNANAHCQWLEKVAIPILTLGISINSNSRDNRKFLRLLCKKSVFFNVRDRYSLDVAKLYCTIEPKLSADLTFAFPFAPLPSSEVKPHRIGISLRKWHEFNADQYSPKFHRQRLWKHHLAKINVEYPIKKFYDESALVQTLGQLNYPTRVIIMDPEHDLTFGGCSEILSESTILDEFGKCDIIIAMRLHACIFATQLGIPFIALNYMPKVGEFCNSINHPYCLDLNDLNRIPGQIEQVFQNYEGIRTSLLNSVQAATLSTNRVFKEALNHIANLSVQ